MPWSLREWFDRDLFIRMRNDFRFPDQFIVLLFHLLDRNRFFKR